MFQPQRGLLLHPRNKNISLGALMEAIYYSQIQRGEPDPGLLAELRRIMEHCTACGKCTAVCPIKIDSAGAALQIRSFLEYKGQGGHPIKTKVLTMLARDPSGRLPKVAKALSLGQTAANRVLGLVPGAMLRGMKSPLFQSQGPHVDFTSLADELKLDQGFILKRPNAAPEDTVLYFPGCGAGLFSHSIGLATLFLLLRSGANVVLPPRHLCCGYPLLTAGCQEAYQANRHRTLTELLDVLVATGKAGLMATTLITACGTCRESLETYEFARELAAPPRHLDAMQYLLEPAARPLPGGRGTALPRRLPRGVDRRVQGQGRRILPPGPGRDARHPGVPLARLLRRVRHGRADQPGDLQPAARAQEGAVGQGSGGRGQETPHPGGLPLVQDRHPPLAHPDEAPQPGAARHGIRGPGRGRAQVAARAQEDAGRRGAPGQDPHRGVAVRVLAVDFGLKRVGLAVCDPQGILASPLPALHRDGRDQFFADLLAVIAAQGVQAVVVGLPLALDGSETLTTRQARNFAESLRRRLTIPVHFEDERLTSAAAEEELKEAGLCARKRKEHLDSQAAVQILRSWLDRAS
jgi:RNAse H-fold protein YqgF